MMNSYVKLQPIPFTTSPHHIKAFTELSGHLMTVREERMGPEDGVNEPDAPGHLQGPKDITIT